MKKNASKHRSGKVDELASVGEARILTLWGRENVWFRHGEILRRASGINPRTAERILARLVRERVLERKEMGQASYYRKLEAPKEFEAVHYLSELDSRLSKGMAYEFDVGNGFNHVAFGRLVGFPDLGEEDLREDEREVLQVLTCRLGYIFQGLWLLRNAIIIRRMGADVPINEEALRAFLFESVADRENRRRGGIRDILVEAKPDTIPEKAAAILREDISSRAHSADIEQTADFFLSEGTIDEFLDRMTNSKSKYSEMNITQLLRKQKALERRMSRFAASAESKRVPSGEPLDDIVAAMIEIPPEIGNEDHEVRQMIAYRVGEALRNKGLRESNELGLVMTAHPWTSSQFADAEQLVYSDVKHLGDLLASRQIVKGTPEFAREAGERVAHYYNLDLDVIKGLRRKPWFVEYLGSYWSDFANAFAKERIAIRDDKDRFLERMLGRHRKTGTNDGKSSTSA
jgi:hypothetical protein